MSNINTDGLPPEMQARIAEIIEKAKASATPAGAVNVQAPAAAIPPGMELSMDGSQYIPQKSAPRPPSLMDHVIALRQEVNQLAQMLQAQGQVTEAVGNAVGQMYGMFQEQTQPSSYSASFQEAQPSAVDDY